MVGIPSLYTIPGRHQFQIISGKGRSAPPPGHKVIPLQVMEMIPTGEVRHLKAVGLLSCWKYPRFWLFFLCNWLKTSLPASSALLIDVLAPPDVSMVIVATPGLESNRLSDVILVRKTWRLWSCPTFTTCICTPPVQWATTFLGAELVLKAG